MKPPAPFACTYSPNLPELLTQLDCSLAISTYQAGKVVLVSAKSEEELVQLPRDFRQAMAMGVSGDRLAIASLNEVTVLANSPGLAAGYPRQPGTYDALYVPRATYYAGRVDIHGLEWGTRGLWAVNTSFSSLVLINDEYSFVPVWKPPFITDMVPEDRCHLNGVAMKDGEPYYVTAVGTGNEFQSWRNNILDGGVLMHVPSGQVIMKNLPMPHTPRLYDGKLYMLFSATGDVVAVEPENKKYEVVNRINGFIRGMARCGDHLFVGQSKLRKNSSTFKDLPFANKAKEAGVTVIHMPTGSIVAELKYQASVDEIYDIQVLPGVKRPGILNADKGTHNLALSIPGATYWAAEQEEEQ